ncbi:MAG TPA: serine/threonine-protein kinase, partial [Anaeromyxobacteraceae bacterium]|nr:serine/threonine-protein kinase [Anaeromyxobacteraceae bacterium]
MGEGAGDGARGDPRGGGSGALSRLLDELARAPRADPEAAWGKGLRPGDVLDRFEIIRELGRGGFGAVYEAVDRELGRKVALKTLRPGRSRDEWVDAQLRAEAQAAARLSHPGIVTLHEACTCDRGPYLVMELLRGETLEARLARGPLPPGEAVEVALQISRALAHVHSHGLVHRDLKPGNVFLGEDGRVKLLDLGLAHLLGRKSSTGGTPAYVAPEQWRGEAVDGRADVFALGAVIFEMVSGKRAFEVKEERSSALDPGPAPALEGKVSRGLVRLVARSLAKDPGARPTAAQAAEDLLAIQRGLARPRAARRLALLVGTGVLAGIAIATLALRGALQPAGGGSPEGRIAVAVADVVNETGEKELDVLSGLLVTSLEQSRRLSVMTQARVLDLAARAGRKDAARVDETLGREVGKAHGVRALLLPAVRRLGTTYSLEMRAIDPGRDEHLFTLSDRATSKEGLLDLLDRLSERTRLELGEGRKEVAGANIQLGEAMTRSLEAYQHYVAGLEGWNRDGLRAVALVEFEEALR